MTKKNKMSRLKNIPCVPQGSKSFKLNYLPFGMDRFNRSSWH